MGSFVWRNRAVEYDDNVNFTLAMLKSSKNFGGGVPAPGTLWRRCRSAGWVVIVFSEVIGLAAAESSWPGPAVSVLTNVAQLRWLASRQEAVGCAVRLKGVVLWASPAQDQLLLQDDSGAIQVDLRVQPPVQAGQRVRLEGTCLACSGILKEVLVDNDGLHPVAEKSGTVYLAAGRHAIRADWFNGPGRFELEVEYEGPGLPRQKIPDAVLFPVDRSNGTTNPVKGLEYRCYEGHWDRVPDFQRLPVVQRGTAANFDLRVRTRDEEVGLQFIGYVEVPRDGLYTFWTKSDDGSRLFVGESSLRLNVLGSGPLPVPRRLVPGQALREGEEDQWTEVEGTVTSVRADPSGVLQVEVSAGTNHLYLDVENASGLAPALFSRIRATGICRSTGRADSQRIARRLIVPDTKQIEVLAALPNSLSCKISQVAELRRLAATGQRIVCPIHLEGLILAVSPNRGLLTFQDDSGAALMMEMDLQGREVRPGQKVVLEGNSVVAGSRVILGNLVLVDNDGLHIMLEKSGAVFLNAGKHSIHLSWFNAEGEYGLEVYYQGPDLPRQKVPDSVLFRPEVDPASNALRWHNGLDYRCYEGAWARASDFNLLTPVRQGSTTNFDIRVASRAEDVGLEFSGFVEVPRDGVYTFSTISDDGSLLFVDEQPPRLEVTGTSALPEPCPIAARQILHEDQQNRWSQVEGTVTFASEESGVLGAGAELRHRSHTPRGGGRFRPFTSAASKQPDSGARDLPEHLHD